MHRIRCTLTLYRAKTKLRDILYIRGIADQILQYSSFREATRLDLARTRLRIMSPRPIFHWSLDYVITDYTQLQRLLFVSIRAKNSPAFTSLLKAGASPHDALTGVPPLYVASYVGAFDIVRILLSSGAFPNASTTLYRITPLMVASQQGHNRVIELLIQNGADETKTDIFGQTAHMMLRVKHIV